MTRTTGPVATLGLNSEEKEAVEAFRRDVVEPSMTQLVILDFWAEWCGPCKQLGPVLEKVAEDYAEKGVVLVKVDVDANRFIAGQFQVQSIPTVYAIFQGQPVANLTHPPQRPATAAERAPRGRALLALSGLVFFLVMAGYFILRPIRDQMGVAGGVDNLAWLFSGTLLAMLAINPLFSMLVSRWPRPRFVAFCYRALMLCLLGFYLALVGLPEASQVWIGRVFFIWVSVFSLFAVSVFWAVRADVFQSEQSRRLYGVIAAGGSLGALVGGLLTSSLVAAIGAPALLLVSLGTLELALWCMFAINRRGNLVAAAAQRPQDEVVGGKALDGFRMALRSPYLLGMCGYMLLYTIGSTFL